MVELKKNKILDCITFFDNNFMFELRYNILCNYVDYFVVCESLFDHRGNPKKENFIWKQQYDEKKIKYFVLKEPFPDNKNLWKNQAIQREFLLSCTDFADPNDYIFFSDPDEIPNPEILKNFHLKKKFGIFLQKFYNFKFNLFNPFETPWDGCRVAKKKNLKSIDYMREKIKSKNLRYKFWRIDKEKDIEVFNNGGWHFNNIMSPEEISLKLKTFAHSEYSLNEFTNLDYIKKKIEDRQDLFGRGHQYKKVKLDNTFPDFLIQNKDYFKKFIIE